MAADHAATHGGVSVGSFRRGSAHAPPGGCTQPTGAAYHAASLAAYRHGGPGGTPPAREGKQFPPIGENCLALSCIGQTGAFQRALQRSGL